MTCATPSTAWCRRARRVGAVAASFLAASAPAHAAPSPAATQALLSALALAALAIAVVAIAWARSAHQQMRAMQPVANELFPGHAFALCDLRFVMREDVIDAAAVDVDLIAEQRH